MTFKETVFLSLFLSTVDSTQKSKVGSSGSAAATNLDVSHSSSLSALDNFYQSHLPTQSPFDFPHPGKQGFPVKHKSK